MIIKAFRQRNIISTKNKQTNKQTTTITKNPKPVYRGWDQDLFYSGSESYHSNFDNLEYLLPKQKLLPITSKTLLNSIQL